MVGDDAQALGLARVVDVDVDVQETGGDEEAGRVDDLRLRPDRHVPHRGDLSVTNADGGDAIDAVCRVHDAAAGDCQCGCFA